MLGKSYQLLSRLRDLEDTLPSLPSHSQWRACVAALKGKASPAEVYRLWGVGERGSPHQAPQLCSKGYPGHREPRRSVRAVRAHKPQRRLTEPGTQVGGCLCSGGSPSTERAKCGGTLLKTQVLRRRRQEDLCNSEVSLLYGARSRTPNFT